MLYQDFDNVCNIIFSRHYFGNTKLNFGYYESNDTYYFDDISHLDLQDLPNPNINELFKEVCLKYSTVNFISPIYYDNFCSKLQIFMENLVDQDLSNKTLSSIKLITYSKSKALNMGIYIPVENFCHFKSIEFDGWEHIILGTDK
ncbi:hypothetical protein ACLHFD_001994 [Vibrio alginolyticus]